MKIGYFKKTTKNKSRLKRYAEFFDGFESKCTNSGMISVYKNPTYSEIEEAKSETNEGSIRGVILEDGTVYCWNGVELHTEMPSQFHPDNSFRFAYDNDYDEWIFDLHNYYTFYDGFCAMLDNISILKQFGQDSMCTFFYASDNGLEYKQIDTDNRVESFSSSAITFTNFDNVEVFVDDIDIYRSEQED